MNMKNNRAGMKGRRAIRTLLAGVLLTVTAAGWAAPPAELDLLPQDALELSLQETEEALRLADGGSENTRLSLSEEAWDGASYREAGYMRPVRRALSVCEDCEFHIGVGGTYHAFKGTHGVVIPMTVTWDRSRWEFGVFRFTSSQSSADNQEHTEQLIAHPYWGASLSRRFQLVHRGPLRAFFGFGVSYKTEQDILSVTHWNFSSQLGLRLQMPRLPVVFELSSRHWSNGGVRTPNRGQDFTILTMRFDM
jgi:hypothetical protein